MSIDKLKKFIIIFIVLGLSIKLSAADSKITESKNEFGGKTVEFTLSPDDNDYDRLTKVRFYYDASNNKRKITYYLSEKTAEESGYIIQEEYLAEDKPIEYRMYYSAEEAEKSGITTLIERVNSPNCLIYSDGKQTVYSNKNSFVHNYPILKLSYLEKEFFSDLKSHKSEGDIYIVSALYKKARSFVTFTSDFTELDKTDEEILLRYLTAMGIPEMKDYYLKKSYAESEGKTYTVYIQKNLEPYIKKGLTCLLAYGIIGYNKEVFLISTEFEEISE